MIPLYFLISADSVAMPALSGTSDLAAQVHAELHRLLASTLFAAAPRMSALLRFLVLQMLEGSAARVNEYAIGIEVFGRSAAQYNTGDDPIVRVQVGRLRRKLAAYYDHEGQGSGVRIDIPLGSYMPRVIPGEAGDAHCAGLTFQPLACLSMDAQAQSFTLGLNEELGYRLHRAVGELSHAAGQRSRLHELVASRQLNYLIEGSVRQEDGRARTALRLVDRVRGGIAWCEQLDHGLDRPLARQQQLAEACCTIVCQRLGMA